VKLVREVIGSVGHGAWRATSPLRIGSFNEKTTDEAEAAFAE
jgi:hypothetical protein